MLLSGLELAVFGVGIITAIVLASVYIISQVRRQNAEETAKLAETRGETIEDLRADMARQEEKHQAQIMALGEKHQAEIAELRLEVANLRGHLDALERLKVDQIADRVVQRLIGEDDISIG